MKRLRLFLVLTLGLSCSGSVVSLARPLAETPVTDDHHSDFAVSQIMTSGLPPNAVAWSPRGDHLAAMLGFARLEIYDARDRTVAGSTDNIGYQAAHSEISYIDDDRLAFSRTIYDSLKMPQKRVEIVELGKLHASSLSLAEEKSPNTKVMDIVVASAPAEGTYATIVWLKDISQVGHARSFLRLHIFNRDGALNSIDTDGVAMLGSVLSAAISKNGVKVGVLTSNGWLLIFDSHAGVLTSRFHIYPSGLSGGKGCAFSPDGRFIVTASPTGKQDGDLGHIGDIWEVASGRHIRDISYPKLSTEAIDIAPAASLDWSVHDSLAIANGKRVGVWGSASTAPTLKMVKDVQQDPAHYGAIGLAFSINDTLAVTNNDRILLFSRR